MVAADPDPTPAPFDYDGLADADRKWLHEAALQLRVEFRRSVSAIVTAGRVLSYARNRLGRGKWEPWLEAEAQVPRRSASRLLAVHQAFGKVEQATLEKFTPTALYTLAEPGVPQSIREYAVEQAKDGAEITAAHVHQWIELQRDATPITRKEVRTLSTNDEKAKPHIDADEVHAGANWAMLVQLLGTNGTLYLSHASDEENGDLIASAALVCDGSRKTAAAKTLEAALLELAGEQRLKPCRVCKLPKPLFEFSRRTDSKDGRNHYCLKCEAERVRRYEARKRNAAKKSGKAGVPTAKGTGAVEAGPVQQSCSARNEQVSDSAA